MDEEAAFASGLAQWLAEHCGMTGARVEDVRRPLGGYSSDTVFVEAVWSDGGSQRQKSLVVRMAPGFVGTLRDYDLVSQSQAQSAAAAAGVPVADPLIEGETHWIGQPFILMPRVEGHVIGPVAHLDPWIQELGAADRGQIYDGLLTVLATVHGADASQAPAVPRRDLAQELDYWQDYVAWSNHGQPVPALAEALRWCRRHCPAIEPKPALLWGDVRLENVVIGDDLCPRAVLDWDMTCVGAPEHDLAWFTSLDFTMHHLFGERTDGFPDRSSTIARYEELSGRKILDLEWYETLAMVRSTAIFTRINVLRRDAGKSVLLPIEDNPILDLLIHRLA